MKCEDLEPLESAYLDSELDARTTLEIQRHLTACPDCARAFAAEAKLEAQVAAGLNRGERTPALWEQIEQRVVTAAEAESRRRQAPRVRLRVSWWRELLWPSPQAWAGLAATWVMMLGASYATREPSRVDAAHPVRPPSRELRQVLREQEQMLAELGGLPGRFARAPSETPPPQPRSQRQEQLSNT